MKRLTFLLGFAAAIAFVHYSNKVKNWEPEIVEARPEIPGLEEPPKEHEMIPVVMTTPDLPIAEDAPFVVRQEGDAGAPEVPQPVPPEPLSRELTTSVPSPVKISLGTVTLNAGVPVTLIRDRGEMIDVQWQANAVSIPRANVRNAGIALAVAAPTPTAPVQESGPITDAPAASSLSNSLSVSAHEIGTSKGNETVWQTYYGSYDKNAYRSKALQVEIRNLGRQPSGDCKVMAYWVGKQTDGDIHIHHGEMIPAEVAAASYTRVRFWCPLIASRDTKYVALGIREKEGSKIGGWLVLVSQDGKTVGGVASSPTFQRLLESPAELGPLLASYKPSGRSATSARPQWRDDPLRKEWNRQRGGGVTSLPGPGPTPYPGQ